MGQQRVTEAAVLLLKRYNAYCSSVREKERKQLEDQAPLELLPVALKSVKEYLRKHCNQKAAAFLAGSLGEVSRAATQGLKSTLLSDDNAVWATRVDLEPPTIGEVVILPPSCEARPSPKRDCNREKRKRERRENKEADEQIKKAARLAQQSAWRDSKGDVSDQLKLADLLQGRQNRALRTLEALDIERERRKPGDPQLCTACGQYRGKKYKGPNGQPHCVIGRTGRGGRLWYPYVDSMEELEADLAIRKKKSESMCREVEPTQDAKCKVCWDNCKAPDHLEKKLEGSLNENPSRILVK
ncbi:hypothetical protein Pmar_PMAR015514 [Perkinsus marinus ATCC 50983]|uniref:Uncharacterized protein n=1 Tax=Perkinsus marinus (strain ATCC 50983 / TXsc) TaxID=423536 RepID=C5LRH1_PERM5|nr:hypothetical protein Pmar_PMAR015514 [Perkinsus marinus ATCC 50983]EER00672.1 hypothetical protein Pmar_PMAR015514 [Perkinsus marinus ATCC 50983]|eukprot:XP_002767954.1 hypothetical protein Pmar_PMAR015514 [Perkinsus marinus ATCC 50983]